jgi:hypothetical protein
VHGWWKVCLVGEYTEQTPKPIDRGRPSLAGVSLVSAVTPFSPQGGSMTGSMWWVLGIALAILALVIIVVAAYVLTRRPSRRMTIVLERD